MKTVFAFLLGLVVAFAIACGGGSAPMQKETAPPPPGGTARAEIDRLDAEITAQMDRLQAMGGVAPVPAPAGAECKPGTSATCSETCTLKDSICANATRICELAAQLGGADPYANDKCTRGKESCTAATARCCNCT